MEYFGLAIRFSFVAARNTTTAWFVVAELESIIQKHKLQAQLPLNFSSQIYKGCLRTRLMNGTTRTRANQGVAHRLSPIRRGRRAFTTAHAVAILLGSG